MPNDMITEEMLSAMTPEEIEAEIENMKGRADSDLKAAIEEFESSSFGAEADQMATDRARAIDYYLGTETLAGDIDVIEGRSHVVSKDTFDTIEWIKPALMRIFASGEKIVEFAPQNEGDVEAAEQESDYIDYIVQRKNSWFMSMLEWFTDALLTRNAYCWAAWEKKTEPTIERYQGLTDDQMAMVAHDQEVKITKHQAYQAPMPIPPEALLQLMQAGMLGPGTPPPMITLHDVELRRSSYYGCTKFHVLPPERCLVAEDTPGVSVRSSDFFEYWEWKTISSLRSIGYVVEDDVGESSRSGQSGFGVIEQARDQVTETSSGLSGQSGGATTDSSMRKVKARWIWIRHDYDQDGIAELRHVVCVGNDILVKAETGEECNEEVTCIPVATIVPIPMPHRHIGLSMHDAVCDLQLIKTAIERGVIDNQFLQNNGRYGVDEDRVNLDDMMVSRPGGTVRTKGPPQTAILPFVHPSTAAQGIEVLNYLDGIRQDRGGVMKPFAGSDVQSIMAQPGTVSQLTNAASQKIELIARILGEGVKELFSIVHEVTLTHATQAEKVRLRGKWVTVDPRTWRTRSDMTILVGMGIVSRPQQAGAVSQLLALQKEMLPVGLTDLNKLYNGLSKFTESLGFASGSQFFTEPPPGSQFQPPPNPLIEATKIQEQGDALVASIRANSAMAVEGMKQENSNMRTYFETMVKNQSEAQDRFVRAMSEATERMQELRLENVREKPAANNTTVQVAGLDSLSSAVTKMGEVADRVGSSAAAAAESVKELKAEQAKKRKRTIKTDKGKTYTVEDD